MAITGTGAAAQSIAIVQGAAAVASTGVADTIAAGNFVGATNFNNNLSTNDVTFTGLSATQQVGVIGNGALANGNTSFTLGGTVTATTINVANGTTAGNISNTGASVATATVNSTGAANTVGTIDLGTGTNVTALNVNAATNLTATLAADFAATAALTVTGAAASVTLNAGATANFKTIDASALTGGVSIAGGSNLTSFKGGAGNDTFTTAAAYGATTAGIIDALGGTDTLVLNAATDMDTAAEAALYKGFDTLRTAGAQDMSLLDTITAVQLTAAGATTQMTATQAAAVQVRADIGASSLALKDALGTSDVLSLSMGTGGAAAAAATNVTGALTVTGFETLNITTNAGAQATAASKVSTIASITGANLTAINLKGASVTLSNAATAKATTIDASALTGNGLVGLTIAGDLVGGSKVIGSGVVDQITLGAVGTADNSYEAGAGDDVFNATGAQLRSGSVYNKIDGGAGTDTLNLTGGAALTLVDDDFKGISHVEKIVVATTTTNAQSITTGGWVDAGFKATGLDLVTTSTTGAISVTASSFTGNATVSATSTTGAITVATGSGNDKVTVAGGASTVNTGAGNDVVVGGAGIDTITGGTGADTLTGAGAADIFVFGAADSTAAAMDTIVGFNTGGSDVLRFAVAATVLAADTSTATAGANVKQSAGGLVTFATADNTLALKVAAVQADTELDTAGSIAIFVDGADTYVYYAGTAIGNTDDQFIKLAGVNTLTAITGTGTTDITLG